MPKWKGIHAFPLEVESRALDSWKPDAGTRAAVLGVAEAALEIISTHQLQPQHVQAFVHCVRVEHSDPRAWSPGAKRLVEATREFGAAAGSALDAELRDPRIAARLLSLGASLIPAERELALNTLLSASPETRRAVIAGEALRLVRIEVQHREVELAPRGVDATLVELEQLLPGNNEEDSREGGPLLAELNGRLEPHHARRVLAVVEAWPSDDLGGFLVDLVRCVAKCEGGVQEIIESFRRAPSLAVSHFLRYECDSVDVRLLLAEALLKTHLDPLLRRELLDAASAIDKGA